MGEEQLPVSYSLKMKIFNMYFISFQAAKICNNMLLAISMIGTAEAMNLGIRFVECTFSCTNNFYGLAYFLMLGKKKHVHDRWMS